MTKALLSKTNITGIGQYLMDKGIRLQITNKKDDSTYIITNVKELMRYINYDSNKYWANRYHVTLKELKEYYNHIDKYGHKFYQICSEIRKDGTRCTNRVDNMPFEFKTNKMYKNLTHMVDYCGLHNKIK